MDATVETAIPQPSGQPQRGHAAEGSLAALMLTALGVVYGDLGTSPLYTLKTVIALSGGAAAQETALGLLSLLIWTLILITSVKYAAFVMRADNDGEGGILALMTLLGVKRRRPHLIVLIGLLGAALIYGDGAVTPAISVLSALEGLNMVTPAVAPYVLPASVAILLLLFLAQPLGTARIGSVFGPIMAIWFVVIGVLGLFGVVRHPSVLVAFNPWLGVHFLLHAGYAGLPVLGGVFLCVTGAEALYADMGHVGARPIRLAWYGMVLPCLVLSYAGQTAILMEGAPAADNIFYRLCPQSLLIPMVILSTVATIVASQSIITGAFSMTRQAIQLGWAPRMTIRQTSSTGYGQIYVGAVNWLLMLATLGLVLGFGKSDNLAAAYGVAVSLTMLLTTMLLFVAMREIWRWNIAAAALVAGAFSIIDATFFTANATKFLEGGWVPLLLAVIVWGFMAIWHRGTEAVTARLSAGIVPVDAFVARLAADHVPRVPGTAVFLTRSATGTPSVMSWYVGAVGALHEHVVALMVVTESVPRVGAEERRTVRQEAPGFWRITGHYGFMERPDIPALLHLAAADGCAVDFDRVTFFVGVVTVIGGGDHKGLPAWQEPIFAFMLRNASHVSDFFKLPRDAVVELGRQTEI